MVASVGRAVGSQIARLDNKKKAARSQHHKALGEAETLTGERTDPMAAVKELARCGAYCALPDECNGGPNLSSGCSCDAESH